MKIQDIKGGYSATPNMIKRVLSPNAYMIFGIINENNHMELEEKEVNIPINTLQLITGIGYRPIKKAIHELVDLHIIDYIGGVNVKQSFKINWDVVQLICSVASRFDDENIKELRNECLSKGIAYFKDMDNQKTYDRFLVAEGNSNLVNKNNAVIASTSENTIEELPPRISMNDMAEMFEKETMKYPTTKFVVRWAYKKGYFRFTQYLHGEKMDYFIRKEYVNKQNI